MLSPLRMSLSLLVSLRYQNTQVTAFKCVVVAFLRYWNRVETVKAMLGQIMTVMYVKLLIILQYLVFSVGLS